ncbi:MAG: TRAP transporter small permease [Sulfitobacter litoralis]|jgi:TRAP-type C4-dicarboxylate transport system permease small subunit|uniref:TRAP transporter small permease protein n=2 Tax=root TaxID=1 RepID=A0A1H0M6T3_9RHOB|nr:MULTISPECIES: TRAP transporter small permease [Sulfitobacter]MBQ0717645.1 TRAP transporter small permease [Sulfitobacter litoralis]MBQ0767278.1 TRAP transporter small permease [Sulfitobacter litoralis]MBQ0802949.1 TRAP transporter small permease [Sulfitobacter litoralis]MCF7725406.1 TRAP transporter small permease subunit [Sulfitobacter sp. M22]MCF7776793.1 TRAP transporter small permease subunit [Sulfitobacter sp. M220]|tara:strand:- start:6529 stop:7158 length:630 start_codon:yes stop_codon:yes gene_type:complete
MAGSSAVLEDGSLLSRIDKGLLRLETVFALVSGIAVFMLMVLAVWSVGGRKFFASPLPGYVDWIEFAMPLIAIMGISYTQRNGGHVRMDILIGQLKGRALWAAETFSVLLIFILMIALIWGSWAHFQRSFDFAAPLWSRDSSIDIGLPIWPAKLIVPMAFSVLALRLLLQIWGYGRAFVLGLESPVAVPLVQSAAEQAMAEAEHLDGRD